MIDLKFIGKQVQRARLEKGWTQDQFAQRLKVHKITLADWEGGKLDRISRLLDIAAATGKTPAWFLTEPPKAEARITPDKIEEIRNRMEELQGILEEIKREKE